MAGELRQTESGTKGVRRLLRKQAEKALEALRNGGRSPSDEAVHSARKSLKKARAYLRLLRPELGRRRYQRENAGLRDVARPLTEVRDAKVLAETLDKLAEHFGDAVDGRALSRLRRALRKEQREVRRRVLEEGDALGPAQESLESAPERVKDLPVGGHGWSVLGTGLKQVYKAGRDAFATARDDLSMENWHEWRKQVKYLWHQLQALQPLWPRVLEEIADQAHALADLLGEDHDLAVLRDHLTGDLERFPDREAVAGLACLIDRRRAGLQEQATALGRRLYEEKPKRFVARLGGYWDAWRRESANGAAEEAEKGADAGQAK
jgi:CHAD domain-containing protein